MEQKMGKLNRIFKYLGIEKEQINSDASFYVDFEFDSFKMGCLVFYLEDYFDIKISEQESEELKTIGDVKNLLRQKEPQNIFNYIQPV